MKKGIITAALTGAMALGVFGFSNAEQTDNKANTPTFSTGSIELSAAKAHSSNSKTDNTTSTTSSEWWCAFI